MVSHDTPTPDEQLADDIATFYADPLGYVMFNWDWSGDPSIQMVKLPEKYRDRFDCEYGPDLWACEFLDELGEDIRERGFDGRIAVDPIQKSTASGHGIGKSTMSAWLIMFIADTRPFSKGTVTANTAEQLKSKTWAELGKWHKRALTRHWFDYNSGRGNMSLVHREHREEWFCTAQTCREENSEAFAGQHAPNSTSYYIFDEASAVPDKIFEVREGGTTDGEPMTFDWGNPTRNSGMFYENCQGRFKHNFGVRKIDSRDVQITNKKRIDRWITDYGLESDFVKVRILGEFPSVGSMQFMPTDAVEGAMLRDIAVDRSDQLLIGVDVARFGDDESVIYPRIGNDCRSFAPVVGNGRYRGLDTVQLVGKVIEKVREFRALGKEYSMIFVDGGGIGGGVVDQLVHLGYRVVEVQFGSKPTDAGTYRYRSDQMWGNLKDKLPRLSLPMMTDRSGMTLKNQLTQRDYGYTITSNLIHLETKADMKSRLGGVASSPDIADALALTFAEDVETASDERQDKPRSAAHDYDPMDEEFDD